MTSRNSYLLAASVTKAIKVTRIGLVAVKACIVLAVAELTGQKSSLPASTNCSVHMLQCTEGSFVRNRISNEVQDDGSSPE